MSVRSKLLSKVPNVVHGFGTLDEELPRDLSWDWETNAPVWKQVHGDRSVPVKVPRQECGDADALYSKEVQIPIAVQTADCVPILLARKDGGMIAAVHAGWRGTQARILHQLWKQLESEGEKPHTWVAAIGPAIGPCCYEVSEDLYTDFKTNFKEMDPDLMTPRFRILDLPEINAALLKQVGLIDVEIIRMCTKCSQKPRFHSYRREEKGVRQWSGLMKII